MMMDGIRLDDGAVAVAHGVSIRTGFPRSVPCAGRREESFISVANMSKSAAPAP